MIDFHTHTLLSDGSLGPSELMNRAAVRGYTALAITDHADPSNLKPLIEQVLNFCSSLSDGDKPVVVPGVELTHVPPARIGAMTAEARALGARVVVVHGQSPVEPVPPGTNMAAIRAGADVLAHPGLVTDEECALAAELSVIFEITTRKGHSLANGHVAAMARKHGVKLILNSDAHDPGDILTAETARRAALGAGVSENEYEEMKRNARALLEKVRT